MQIRNFLTAIVSSFLMLLSVESTAWIIDENFDGQKVGSGCPLFWADGVSIENRAISAEQGASGSNSCKLGINKGEFNWGGGINFPSNLHAGDEVWVRFRIYMPQEFDFNSYSAGNHLKFIRMTERSDVVDGKSDLGRIDWLWSPEGSALPYVEGLERDKCSTDCNQYFGAGNGPLRGSWETYEMYVKWDHVAVNDGGQGRIRAWKNGKLIGDLTDRPTMWIGATRITTFLLFSYWNGSAPKTQHLYLDDLIVTNIAPGARDSKGNPYIGVGSYAYVAPPRPPLLFSSK